MPGFINDGFLGGKGKGGGARGEPGKTPTIGPNGNWFIGGVDTGRAAGGGADLSKFKENEVAIVDAKTGTLIPSGVFAQDGELKVEPDSIIIGAHEWSSSAENMTATNLATGKVYTPLWQEVAPDAKEAFIRAHGGLEHVQRFSDQSTRITNPAFSVLVPDNETAFSVDVVLAAPATNIIMEVFLAGEKLYRSRWKSKPAGEVNLELNTPSDFKANTTYQVRFTSKDGDLVMMGDSNGNPRYKSNFAKWTAEKIATETFVIANAKGGVQPTPITADDIAKATDRGEFTGSGSLKGLTYGWWVVKASNTKVTGRPSGSQGDLIIFKQGVSGSNGGTGFAVMLAFGKDSGNKDAVWAEYRDGVSWTAWFKINEGVATPVDLTQINQDIAAINSREAALLRDVSALQTSVGNVYAPSKVVFDREVNALIDAKIKSSGGNVPSVTLPTIYAMFSNDVPTSISGAISSTNGEVTLTRVSTDRSRVFILVAEAEAGRVTGISVNNGLPSNWEPRSSTIDGVKYKAFYSSGAYSETSLKIKVEFT